MSDLMENNYSKRYLEDIILKKATDKVNIKRKKFKDCMTRAFKLRSQSVAKKIQSSTTGPSHSFSTQKSSLKFPDLQESMT